MRTRQIFFEAFTDEIGKIGGVGQIIQKVKPFLVSHWPGLVGAGLGAASVYDISKAIGTPELKANELIGTKEERVAAHPTIKALLKNNPIDKPVIPVTTRDEARKMIDDLEKEYLAENPRAEKWDDESRMGTMQYLLSIIGKGQNAAALSNIKEDKFYIVTPPKVNRVVLEHELGHVRDWSRKDFKEPGILSSLTSMVWWPSYRKTVMEPEERAWSPVSFKKPEEEALRDKALKTYEGGFHLGRGVTSGILGALTAGTGYAVKALLAARRGR